MQRRLQSLKLLRPDHENPPLVFGSGLGNDQPGFNCLAESNFIGEQRAL